MATMATTDDKGRPVMRDLDAKARPILRRMRCYRCSRLAVVRLDVSREPACQDHGRTTTNR